MVASSPRCCWWTGAGSTASRWWWARPPTTPALPRPTTASWLALAGPSALGLAAGGLAAAAVWGPETVAKGLTLLLWATTVGLVGGCAAVGRVLRL